MLSEHFSESELGYDKAPGIYQGNLRAVANLLESFRAAAGVPFVAVSGYRDPKHNKEVGGSETSQHLTGSAADFTPQGITIAEFINRVGRARAQGHLPPWGQLIVYPFTTGHVHLSLPTDSSRNVVLVKMAEGGYQPLTPELAATFPGAAGAVALLLGLGLAAYYLGSK